MTWSIKQKASVDDHQRSLFFRLGSIPDSRQRAPLGIPDCRLPTPDSRLPIPDSRFPIPDSRLPIPDSRFSIPDSRFPILLNKSG